MISASGISLYFGERPLFKEVNIKFTEGNCYGIIGANGSGKSTFLKILSGEIESSAGEIIVGKNERIAVLRQDHYAFDEYEVLETVIMGHKKLYDLMKERDELYSKADFSDEDGIKAGDIEEELANLNGYNAESDAATMLSNLGIPIELNEKKMKMLEGGQKVKVLLAQAMFGNPDILLLDEPTNHLDLHSIEWLENFLFRFKNTVIVVSHDRHFLNKVCTHIADIDFNKIQLFVGNYKFWSQASQLAIQQKKQANKKQEEKAEELKTFIQRFSANASKAKQATSRKKILEKLTLKDIPQSSRRNPYIAFSSQRECGKVILNIENISKKIDKETVLNKFSHTINKGDKIAFVGKNHLVNSTIFDIISGNMKPDSGAIEWGQTITHSYFPKDNSSYFSQDLSLMDWLKQYSENKEETFVRGFLGRMLFSGEDSSKKTSVLSGGEKVRCMLSMMMLSGANVMIFDQPTNHLDLESITAVNNALIKYSGVLLFSSHDHQFINTIANRIIEITPNGVIDRMMTFDEYFKNEEVQKMRDKLYHGHLELEI